jgi:transcriptional regulator with XRE-family HTH domain
MKHLETQMTLGQLLREARQRKQMTLREVEKLTQISNGYLSLMESDSIKSPSPNHLNTLADVYGASYSLLMELAGYAVPTQHGAPLPEALLGDVKDLSEQEWSQVRNFVGYLRSARSPQK